MPFQSNMAISSPTYLFDCRDMLIALRFSRVCSSVPRVLSCAALALLEVVAALSSFVSGQMEV